MELQVMARIDVYLETYAALEKQERSSAELREHGQKVLSILKAIVPKSLEALPGKNTPVTGFRLKPGQTSFLLPMDYLIIIDDFQPGGKSGKFDLMKWDPKRDRAKFPPYQFAAGHNSALEELGKDDQSGFLIELFEHIKDYC